MNRDCSDEEMKLIEELRVGDGIYYVSQERWGAPGVSGEWPKVIAHPSNKHGRLVQRIWPKVTAVASADVWDKLATEPGQRPQDVPGVGEPINDNRNTDWD